MKLPRGELVRERVVSDVGTVLETVLEGELTGYVRLESQDALLLDGDGIGILTFEDGVPSGAYHTGTDRAGTDALADIAVAGPYGMRLYELSTSDIEPVHDDEGLRLPPALPAKRLAGDPALAERTTAAAPESWVDGCEDEAECESAVEAFLDDEETIESIQHRAREQAQERAEEWNLRR